MYWKRKEEGSGESGESGKMERIRRV